MEPPIQYAHTADGVSIAYWTLGEGMPLVCMPPVPLSHIQAEWHIPDWRGWYEWLGRNRKLIRYDGRGSGLSDREVIDFSLESQILDLEAVLVRLDLERFVLFAQFFAGPVAITYAARHPYRVSHLLLWHTFARAPDYAQMPHIVPRINSSAEEAGRPTPRVVVALPIAVTDDAAEGRQRAARLFQVYGTLPNYRRVLDIEGAAGPAEVAVVGNEEEVESQLRRIAAAGATDFLAGAFPAEDDAQASLKRTRTLLKALVGAL